VFPGSLAAAGVAPGVRTCHLPTMRLPAALS
jgi:hypothetical protein